MTEYFDSDGWPISPTRRAAAASKSAMSPPSDTFNGMPVFTPAQAHELVQKGWRCECCQALHKTRQRALNATMVQQLATLYRYFRNPAIYDNLRLGMTDEHGEWLHVPRYLTHNRLDRDYSKLRFWGFVVLHPGPKDDGNPRNGYARLTGAGREFCENKTRVPGHILTTNQGKGFIGFVGTGLVSIVEAAGTAFDYDKEIQ
jgi:hypothetical protein